MAVRARAWTANNRAQQCLATCLVNLVPPALHFYVMHACPWHYQFVGWPQSLAKRCGHRRANRGTSTALVPLPLFAIVFENATPNANVPVPATYLSAPSFLSPPPLDCLGCFPDGAVADPTHHHLLKLRSVAAGYSPSTVADFAVPPTLETEVARHKHAHSCSHHRRRLWRERVGIHSKGVVQAQDARRRTTPPARGALRRAARAAQRKPGRIWAASRHVARQG